MQPMRSCMLSLVPLWCSLAAAQTPPKGAPWQGAAMAAAPADIARAARELATPPGIERQVLLDEQVFRYRSDGAAEQRSHEVYRLLTPASVKSGASV